MYEKRQAPRVRRNSFFKKIYQNEREKRKVNKFIKNFVNKRTKPTASTHKGIPVTKAKKNLHKTNKNKQNIHKTDKDTKQGKRIVDKIDKITVDDKRKEKFDENKDFYKKNDKFEAVDVISSNS